MSQGHPVSEARNGNFILIVGEDRELMFSVTDSNVADITLNTTYFATGDKDVYLPSNKIETDPLIVTFIISENYKEWITIFKWIMKLRNNPTLEYVSPIELIALDSQNRPSTRFLYSDCFPISLESIQFSLNNEGNQVITTTTTFRYNKMKVITSDGETIDENYGKGI